MLYHDWIWDDGITDKLSPHHVERVKDAQEFGNDHPLTDSAAKTPPPSDRHPEGLSWAAAKCDMPGTALPPMPNRYPDRCPAWRRADRRCDIPAKSAAAHRQRRASWRRPSASCHPEAECPCCCRSRSGADHRPPNGYNHPVPVAASLGIAARECLPAHATAESNTCADFPSDGERSQFLDRRSLG